MLSNLFRRKKIDDILHNIEDQNFGKNVLNKKLGVFDLTMLGVAGIIGAGIFSVIGNAAYTGGPAIVVLFAFIAVTCGFSALCYAQFASIIPVSGSAYTYSYVVFGELIAWIIGWDLIIEYAVGNIAIAISWSDYFTHFVNYFGVNVPAYLSTDYLTAFRGFTTVSEQIKSGISINEVSPALQEAFSAYKNAPVVFGMRLIADIPAFSIVILITYIAFIGINESRIANNILVILKLAILMLVILFGSMYIDTENWQPFAPNGIEGVLKGTAGVFFAYIGFDAISTTAEESRNPQKDLPRSIIYSIIITTIMYIAIGLVITGMVSYKLLGVGDPLAFVFSYVGAGNISFIISLSAIIAMASVLLVFQIGQPRIWMSMSRDGLLPEKFSRIHKKHRTPAFATIVTGILVAVPTLFLNLTEVTDLTSIGTLFAFALVSGGVLFLNKEIYGSTKPTFRIPYINSRKYLPLLWISIILIILFSVNNNFFENIISGNFKDSFLMNSENIVFISIAAIFTFFAIYKEFSLIPGIALLSNLYLMCQLGLTNWIRFGIWLLIGLIIYFLYGYRKSKLREKQV